MENNKNNNGNDENKSVKIIIWHIIVGLILLIWVVSVSVIMIPVLLAEANKSAENCTGNVKSWEISVSVREDKNEVRENKNEIKEDREIEENSEVRENSEVNSDGPRVFKYVGDWNSCVNGTNGVINGINRINTNSSYNGTGNSSAGYGNMSNVNSVSNVNSATQIQYLNTTAGEMIRELRENALRAETQYQDAYVIVTGRIRNIDSDGKYISIGDTFGHYIFDSIMCHITDEKQMNAIMEMNVGDSVTVCGQISNIGEIIGYHLNMSLIRGN